MFIRFAVAQIDRDSSRGLGVFQVAFELRAAGRLYEHESLQLKSVLDWFDVHLEKPDRFTASKPPYYRKQRKAISWFKASAREHIAKIREVIVILESHGILVDMIKAERVGYVVYEDDFQAVAEPFADTVC